MDEPTTAQFASWTATALRTAGVTGPDRERFATEVCPAADAAYKDALVRGLCLDGAREIFVTTVAEEARRRLHMRG